MGKERINELLTQVENSIKEKLPPFIDAMRNYITNLTTRNIFYQTIKDQVAQSLLELQQILDREYKEEEKTAIHMEKMQTLIADLEKILTDSFEKETRLQVNIPAKSQNQLSPPNQQESSLPHTDQNQNNTKKALQVSDSMQLNHDDEPSKSIHTNEVQ